MIPYAKIQFATALRSGQIIGSNAATLEASYADPWSDAVLDGAEVPFSAFEDDILAIEKELAHIIGSDIEHPYRESLYGRSAALADNALIPTVSDANFEFIGVFSGVFDEATDRQLTEQPVQVLDDLESSFFSDTNFYNFAFAGGRVRHTVTTAYCAGCVWDRATQAALYNANGSSPLPQMLESTWIAGVLDRMRQAGWSEGGELASYGQSYQNGIQMLRLRDLSSPTLPVNKAVGR